MSNITNVELTTAQDLAQMFLLLATQHEAHIGLGSLIMAAAVAGISLNVDQDKLVDMFDATVTDLLAVNAIEGEAEEV